MIAGIQPSRVTGNIVAAASKSSMQRACAAALLAKGQTTLINPGNSNDDLAALDVIQKLGAKISKFENGNLLVTSNGVQPIYNEINCGESGLGIRMFTPIAALSSYPLTLNGTGSLLTRPMDFFDSILPKLSVQTKSNNGKLPLNIHGPLQPANIEVDGSLSSQFLTGLLMSFAAAGADQVTISVNDLKSKPYIDLTLQVMKYFGWEVENKNYQAFTFIRQTHNPQPATRNYLIEGDWSGAAFLLVAGAISGPVTVKGLDIESTQADKAILQALMDSGCNISVQTTEITVSRLPMKAFHFNATDCPDLFPPLVALASYCNGITVIEGVNRLTHKESNRSLTLQQEFAKLGVEILLQDDLMMVKGGGAIKGAKVHSHHDHRIAMACAVAALGAKEEVLIEEAEAINKSYPDFYSHLKQLGALVNV